LQATSEEQMAAIVSIYLNFIFFCFLMFNMYDIV